MPDLRWSVDGIEAESLVSGQPTWTVGASVRLAFRFDAATRQSNYESLRDYLEYAGTVTVERSTDGVPLVAESVPARAPVDSHIVTVDPIGSDIAYTTDWWVAITGGTDRTRPLGTGGTESFVVELDAVVLAPGDDYADRESLLADLSLIQLARYDPGRRLYLSGDGSDAVYQYGLSTPFDVTDAPDLLGSFDVSSEADSPLGVAWRPNGTRLYLMVSDGSDLYQYDAPTTFDVTDAPSTAGSLNVGNEDLIPDSVAWNDDGTRVYILGKSNDNVYQYDVSTAFDVTTATTAGSFDISSEADIATGIAWNDDGTVFYISDDVSASIYQYSVSTAFDVTTASVDGSFDVSSEDDIPTDVLWNADGSVLYVLGRSNANLYQYDASTAFDVTDAPTLDGSFDVSGEEATPRAIAWNGASQYPAFNSRL